MNNRTENNKQQRRTGFLGRLSRLFTGRRRATTLIEDPVEAVQPPDPTITPRRKARITHKTTGHEREAFVRKATKQEVEIVISGSGWPGASQGLPGGESNSRLSAFQMRGRYPRAGYSEQMLRSNASVYSGFERQLLTVASLNWDILPPSEPDNPSTDVERWQTNWIRQGYRRLPLGFIGSVVLAQFTYRLHGFSALEKVFDIDEETGYWRLSRLMWIPPWSVDVWVLDESGSALGCIIKDERGRHFLPWEKMVYAGQMFWGRNYEGLGIARPLKPIHDHKSQILIDDAKARERAASGIPYASASNDDGRYETDHEAVKTMLGNILYGSESDPAYYIAPPGWEIGVNYLDNGMPDSTSMLNYLDHQTAQQMTDTLSQLGVSEHGARAVGSEQRIEKWSMLGGLCNQIAHNIDHSIHRQIYELNGWDTRRICRTVAEGVQNVEMYRRLLEFLTTPVPDNPVVETTTEMREQIKRSLGLRD